LVARQSINTKASTLKKKDSLTDEAYLLLGYVEGGYSERDWFNMILVALALWPNVWSFGSRPISKACEHKFKAGVRRRMAFK
jgi:hypothetical protein